MDRFKPFYQKHINRSQQERYIQTILKEYEGKPLNDDLYKELYDRLAWEKHLGNICMPFKLERKSTQRGEGYFEVILESKV